MEIVFLGIVVVVLWRLSKTEGDGAPPLPSNDPLRPGIWGIALIGGVLGLLAIVGMYPTDILGESPVDYYGEDIFGFGVIGFVFVIIGGLMFLNSGSKSLFLVILATTIGLIVFLSAVGGTSLSGDSTEMFRALLGE